MGSSFNGGAEQITDTKKDEASNAYFASVFTKKINWEQMLLQFI